jgi:glutathione S-transferase
MTYVVIVVALALVQFLAFGSAVGWARGKYQVAAPATTGNEIFERYFRVQMNTLEQLVVFLPAIWMFATQVSASWAAGLGAVYLAGRLIYFFSYTRDPKSRGLGFALSSLPLIVMVLGVLIAAIRQLLS